MVDASIAGSWLDDGRIRLFLGALVGAIVAFVIFGADVLSGDPAVWQPLGGDAGNGLAAFRYYLDEPWGFPLLHVEQLNDPDGLVIVFTDSLSAWALVAKLLAPLGGTADQWFAAWYLLIYTLQGLAAVAAIRAWGVRSLPIELAAAVIAVSAPIMMLRTWHPGLAGQFTLLLAWAAVGHLLAGDGSNHPMRVLAWGSALALLSLFIQPYLFLCVVVMLAAAGITAVLRDLLSWRQYFAWGAGSALAVGVAGAITGIFSSTVAEAKGYGIYGTYVFGPVIPQWSRLWPGNDWILEANGSFEGFNWVGMGWLLLGLIVLVSRPRQVLGVLERHQVVAAALALLGLYAVTPAMRLWNDDPHDWRTPLGWIIGDRVDHRLVYGLGGLILAGIGGWWLRRRPGGARALPGPALIVGALGLWSLAMLVAPGQIDRLTGQFRVSGRLLWPLSYGVLLASIVILFRSVPRRVAVAVVVAAAVVQVIDVQQFRDQAESVLTPIPERSETMDALAGLVDAHDYVHLEPDFECAAVTAGPEAVLMFQDVTIAASRSATPIDNAYAARLAPPACDEPPVLDADNATLNVVMIPIGGGSSIIPPAGQECRVLGHVLACSARWDQVDSGSAQAFAPR